MSKRHLLCETVIWVIRQYCWNAKRVRHGLFWFVTVHEISDSPPATYNNRTPCLPYSFVSETSQSSYRWCLVVDSLQTEFSLAGNKSSCAYHPCFPRLSLSPSPSQTTRTHTHSFSRPHWPPLKSKFLSENYWVLLFYYLTWNDSFKSTVFFSIISQNKRDESLVSRRYSWFITASNCGLCFETTRKQVISVFISHPYSCFFTNELSFLFYFAFVSIRHTPSVTEWNTTWNSIASPAYVRACNHAWTLQHKQIH